MAQAAGGGKGKSGAAAGGFGAAMGKIAKVGAVGLVALGLTAVKMSNTFQTEMLKIRTEGGATQKEFTAMRAGVLNLAATGQSFGQGPTSLAQGLYHLESMGIRGKKALLGLKLASAEAAISGASLEDTTTSLGGALFIAAKGTHGITGAMGALNAIAGSGNMRFQELNEALGTGLLGSAKVAGVSLQEMGAALAVLTDSGYKASSAGAQLGTALHYLYAPTQKAEGALNSIGLTGKQLAADLRKPQGILAALKDLKAHMGNLSPSDQANVLNDILPGGRGRVLLNLYQMQGRLAPKYNQIRGTENDFGKHMAEQAQNPATKLAVAWAKVQAMMIIMGDTLKKYLMPVALLFVAALVKLLQIGLAVFNWFVKMNPAAKALGVFIGVLAAAFLLYNTAVTVAAIATGAFEFAVMLLTTPITLVIIAIAALAAGVVYAYNKFGWFRTLVNGVWNWLKGAATDTAHWVVNAFGNVVNFFAKLPGRIGGFFSSAFTGVKSIVVDILNWIITQMNHVIDVLDSLNISTPFGNIGIPHINHLGLIGTGGGSKPKGTPSRNLNHSQLGHQGTADTVRQMASTKALALKDRPMLLTGDVVMKVKGREIGRVTRDEIHKTMMA